MSSVGGEPGERRSILVWITRLPVTPKNNSPWKGTNVVPIGGIGLPLQALPPTDQSRILPSAPAHPGGGTVG